MKVVTGDQMRNIDRIAIQERDIPGEKLMEKAGRSVAFEILERFDPGPVVVVAGKGNNAGDGFVVARCLHEQNWPVRVVNLADPDGLDGDAKTMYERIPEGVEQMIIEDDAEAMRDALEDHDLIVDSILGTGIKGAVRGFLGEAIEVINGFRIPVVSVDIPSGLQADGGEIEGPVVNAVLTVTMGLPKLGMLIQPGVKFTGNVIVAELDFPDDLLNSPELKINLLTERMIDAFLPERPPDGHKGTFGSVIVVGGSPGMTGAPVMASRSAMRAGTGLVYCATAEGLRSNIDVRLLEELTIALPSANGRILDKESLQALPAHAARMKAMALGPGLGRASETQHFVRSVVEDIQIPMVIDADALNALGGHLDTLHSRSAATVLTPHPGEMSRLTGLSTTEIQKDRIGVAKKLATGFKVVVVLKGAQTIIATPDGEIYINPTGNTGLAKGGSGDVLTGLIAGFLAQKPEPVHAACCGVFLHGLASDLIADEIPPRSMVPSDVIAGIPKAFAEIARQTETLFP